MSIIPLSIRRSYVRIKWFLRNYGKIEFDSTIFNPVYGQPTYNTDGMATSTNSDFIKDKKFAKAYEKAKLTNPWPNFTLMWRIHVICWAADNAKRLEGDFVECGVNTGAYARAIIDYIDFESTKKKFYLMDTFEGLNQEHITDSEKKLGIGRYKYRNTYEEVKQTFAPFNTKIIKGSIPETLTQCDVQKVCFLSIDMNNMIPEIAAMEYFWDKVVINGMIVLDDYGFPMHIHQKHAFDKFAASVGHEILCLPTGQGIILKTH
ncbi:MAG: TylF/MycF/NovP-related O-methyltransferase [Bacteroidota bacterium]